MISSVIYQTSQQNQTDEIEVFSQQLGPQEVSIKLGKFTLQEHGNDQDGQQGSNSQVRPKQLLSNSSLLAGKRVFNAPLIVEQSAQQAENKIYSSILSGAIEVAHEIKMVPLIKRKTPNTKTEKLNQVQQQKLKVTDALRALAEQEQQLQISIRKQSDLVSSVRSMTLSRSTQHDKFETIKALKAYQSLQLSLQAKSQKAKLELIQATRRRQKDQQDKIASQRQKRRVSLQKSFEMIEKRTKKRQIAAIQAQKALEDVKKKVYLYELAQQHDSEMEKQLEKERKIKLQEHAMANRYNAEQIKKHESQYQQTLLESRLRSKSLNASSASRITIFPETVFSKRTSEEETAYKLKIAAQVAKKDAHQVKKRILQFQHELDQNHRPLLPVKPFQPIIRSVSVPSLTAEEMKMRGQTYMEQSKNMIKKQTSKSTTTITAQPFGNSKHKNYMPLIRREGRLASSSQIQFNSVQSVQDAQKLQNLLNRRLSLTKKLGDRLLVDEAKAKLKMIEALYD